MELKEAMDLRKKLEVFAGDISKVKKLAQGLEEKLRDERQRHKATLSFAKEELGAARTMFNKIEELAVPNDKMKIMTLINYQPQFDSSVGNLASSTDGKLREVIRHKQSGDGVIDYLQSTSRPVQVAREENAVSSAMMEGSSGNVHDSMQQQQVHSIVNRKLPRGVLKTALSEVRACQEVSSNNLMIATGIQENLLRYRSGLVQQLQENGHIIFEDRAEAPSPDILPQQCLKKPEDIATTSSTNPGGGQGLHQEVGQLSWQVTLEVPMMLGTIEMKFLLSPSWSSWSLSWWSRLGLECYIPLVSNTWSIFTNIWCNIVIPIVVTIVHTFWMCGSRVWCLWFHLSVELVTLFVKYTWRLLLVGLPSN